MQHLPLNRSLSWEAEILQMQAEKMMRMRRCPVEDAIHLLPFALTGRNLVEKQAWLSGELQILISCMSCLVTVSADTKIVQSLYFTVSPPCIPFYEVASIQCNCLPMSCEAHRRYLTIYNRLLKYYIKNIILFLC